MNEWIKWIQDLCRTPASCSEGARLWMYGGKIFETGSCKRRLTQARRTWQPSLPVWALWSKSEKQKVQSDYFSSLTYFSWILLECYPGHKQNHEHVKTKVMVYSLLQCAITLCVVWTNSCYSSWCKRIQVAAFVGVGEDTGYILTQYEIPAQVCSLSKLMKPQALKSSRQV